uniref:HNH endonuclease n=1 Tax=Pithovirus LCPAC101 TaxID=2506586 RepID=A0A481Z2F0_9VIRU|nr:MAG: HNH endonuclease [Pithovirus LCPAC101]
MNEEVVQVTVRDMDNLLLSIKIEFGYNQSELYLNDTLLDDFRQISENDIICVKNYSRVEESSAYELIYISGELDNYKFKMIVDSGAQKSVMSHELAKELKLDSIIDKRYKGRVVGVGSAEIIGRIIGCNIKVGPGFFIPVDVDVIALDDPSIFLLGLDFLYPNRCSLDFSKQCITSRNHTIPFLSRKQIEELASPINITREKILSSYQIMKSSISYSDYMNRKKLINKIISNIIMNPMQDKYKKINIQSKLFSDIYEDPSCQQFIRTIGFIEKGNTHIIFRDTNNLLLEARKILSQ